MQNCETEFDSGFNTHVDHNHVTGTVRGLLCNMCNIGIGMFRDNVNFMYKAIKYLEDNNAVHF